MHATYYGCKKKTFKHQYPIDYSISLYYNTFYERIDKINLQKLYN